MLQFEVDASLASYFSILGEMDSHDEIRTSLCRESVSLNVKFRLLLL